MSKKDIYSVPDGTPEFKFLSPAIRAGEFIFVSGTAALIPGEPPRGSGRDWMPGAIVEGGIEAETRQTLENIKMALEAAGASLEDVVKVNAYLRDIDRDFLAYNEVYQSYFPKDPPTRTTVGATIYGKLLVEIECIAYSPMDDD